MIANSKKLQEFENRLRAKEKTNYAKSLKIVEALRREAVFLGVLPLKNPLDGIEVDIRIAKVVNSVPKPA
jgi:hypothetical protein